MLFALALIAAVPVDGVAQDGLDSLRSLRYPGHWTVPASRIASISVLI
jgi:hypothetical protein